MIDNPTADASNAGTTATPAAGASAMLTSQQQALGNFNQNMPYYQGLINSNAVAGAQNNYQGQSQQINQSASARGLLYSGLKDSALQNAQATSAGQQAAQESSGAQGLYNAQQAYTNQAIQSGLNNYQGNVQGSVGGYQNNIQSQAQTNQFIGSLLSGGGKIAGLALSDKKAKKDIKDEDPKKLMVFIDKVNPKSFAYKDKDEDGGKENHGILAQDLEKSDVGKSMVVDTPKGKQVDIAKAVMAMLALQNVMHKRIKKVEAS